jgi:arsenate reductase
MTGNWALPDPSLAKGKDPEIRLAFADAFRMLNNRVVILASLPVRSLDKSALRRELELIAERKAPFKSAAEAA